MGPCTITEFCLLTQMACNSNNAYPLPDLCTVCISTIKHIEIQAEPDDASITIWNHLELSLGSQPKCRETHGSLSGTFQEWVISQICILSFVICIFNTLIFTA